MAKASRTDHSKLKQEGESGIHAIRMHERLKYKDQDVKKHIFFVQEIGHDISEKKIEHH
jgi:hypothetical protein